MIMDGESEIRWEKDESRYRYVSIKTGFIGIYGSEMQFNSSLIASWRSNAEQTQAQSGSEPN